MDNLEVKFYDTVDDSLLKFAGIISQSNGKWVTIFTDGCFDLDTFGSHPVKCCDKVGFFILQYNRHQSLCGNLDIRDRIIRLKAAELFTGII